MVCTADRRFARGTNKLGEFQPPLYGAAEPILRLQALLMDAEATGLLESIDRTPGRSFVSSFPRP